LERQGIRCWIAPRDVTPGEFYADAIVHAIDATQALILVLSRHAAVSHHILREVERASSKRHPVISLRIDRAALPAGLEYFLNTSQWLDASEGKPSRAFPKLVEAVCRVLTGSCSGNGGAPLPPLESMRGRKRRSSGSIAVVLGFIVVAILGFAIDKFWLSKHVTVEEHEVVTSPVNTPAVAVVAEKSIAVLPFLDLSEKHDQEYFADGMVEEIIDLLAKVPDLRVPARTSSFYFKGKSTKVPDIARELSVANMLEGSIRASGNRLRVTAQLIRADTGFHIWSQSYDGDLHDVFKVQDEIANAVVQALQITLMGGPLTRREGGTQNLEAYQLYLRALANSQSNSRPELEEARGYLDQAVKLDPNFALAWTAQASNIIDLAWARALPWDEAFERGRQLAQHALQLTPELASGHRMLGYVYRTHDWNWAAAQDEAQRALRSDPRYSAALLLAGQIATTLGRWDEAERYMRTALKEDPLNTFVLWNFATTLYRAGRYADAESWYERVIEKAPKFEWSHEYLAKTLLADGKPELALAQIQQEPTEGERLDILPMALYAVGRETEANAALQSLIQKFADTDAFWIAANYACRNDRARALQWLNRAYDQREAKVAIEIVGESLFRNVADDPAYKALLRKLNLPE
jgi:TolB-like protein/lipoprotein NlpI